MRSCIFSSLASATPCLIFSATHGLSPADPETIALLGIAEFARGEDTKAIAHLEDALARIASQQPTQRQPGAFPAMSHSAISSADSEYRDAVASE